MSVHCICLSLSLFSSYGQRRSFALPWCLVGVFCFTAVVHSNDMWLSLEQNLLSFHLNGIFSLLYWRNIFVFSRGDKYSYNITNLILFGSNNQKGS